MLIINEISMVGSPLMNSIDKQCTILKNQKSDSTAVFGGLHMVITLGDFHQFSPVGDKAPWQKQESDEEKRGQLLRHMFKEVVILDEQMRQQQDVQYHGLLKRARNGFLTQNDVNILNTRVISYLESQPDQTNNTTCIVRANKLRHVINRLQIEQLARSRQQKVFIFPSRDTRRKKPEKTTT
jgi:PIF1-like helicase